MDMKRIDRKVLFDRQVEMLRREDYPYVGMWIETLPPDIDQWQINQRRTIQYAKDKQR